MIGGVGRVNVTTTDECAWSAVSTVEWITVTNGDSGTGAGVVSYDVKVNATGRQRSGTINIAGISFVVFDWLREQPE